MKIKLSFPGFVIGAVLAATLTVAPAQAEQVLNMAFTISIDSHYGTGAKVFAEELARLSNGKFKLVPRPSGALGGERDVVEGLQICTVEMTITSTGPLGNFVPDILVIDLPFLFRDYAHARAVLDGPVGQELLEKLGENDIVGLAWSESGFRHVTNSVKPVQEPADLDGLKIRTMENEVHMNSFRDLGAAPTPMAFPELFTALQQGTVDGQENPIGVIESSKFYEVQKYLSLTGHFYSPAAILLAPCVWDGLSDEEKEWFRQAAKASVAATRDHVDRINQEGLDRLRQQGMAINEVDVDKFQEAVQEVYGEYPQFQELIERIRNTKAG